MRSVNLIPKRRVLLNEWRACLDGRFEIVMLEHSEGLASREGQPRGALNKLLVEDGTEHLLILERPTTRREYEEDELLKIEQFSEHAEQFFAVDFTESGLLIRVLRLLLEREGRQSILVEDEASAFVLLEDVPGVAEDLGQGS